MDKQARLYLIPSLLGDTSPDKVLPSYTMEQLRQLRYFLVETPREGRRFLSKVGMPLPIQELSVEAMPKKLDDPLWATLLAPLHAGHSIGIVSDAGCPGIADPGSIAVQLAHAAGVPVEPLVGPSSFTLALMAAGFNGQSFTFHGYLPIDRAERKKAILRMEQEAIRTRTTQMFMETPYRNMALLQSLFTTCNSTTRLCIAAALTTEEAFLHTQTIAEWKATEPDIHKKPAVFLLFGP
jgi:16S rRNA (cytidine1402-2'-O)-methyltransferase